MGSQSFFLMSRDIPFHLQKKYKIKNAKIALDAIVIGTGNCINLPKAPEVLTKSIAKLISSKWAMCGFFELKFTYLVTAKAFSLIIWATGLFSKWLCNQERISKYKNALFSNGWSSYFLSSL